MDSTTRPFSKDSNMLLIILHNENYTIDRMAEIMYRDKNSIKQQLIKLFNTGQAEVIHNYLMEYNGLYARKMRKKSMPPILNIREESE